jgi:hypothetical protein
MRCRAKAYHFDYMTQPHGHREQGRASHSDALTWNHQREMTSPPELAASN